MVCNGGGGGVLRPILLPHRPSTALRRLSPSIHPSRLNGTKVNAKTQNSQEWRTLLCMIRDVFLGLVELV